MSTLRKPANTDTPITTASARNPRILEWLSRITRGELSFDALNDTYNLDHKMAAEQPDNGAQLEDWSMIVNLCGYNGKDFALAGAGLPLSVAEIEHFRRNHRGRSHHVSRDFLSARADLPSPLSELYGLYLHRARVDAEAALFLAQAAGTTRVARIMADLLAVGGFANGLEYISYLGVTYSVPAAFDTSDIIDRANFEAARRLALAADHPSHLLKLTPDEIGVLATNIADSNTLTAAEFLEKTNMLAEARQDVTRLPASEHFATAIIERDLPMTKPWVMRLSAAYARLLPKWVAEVPEIGVAVH